MDALDIGTPEGAAAWGDVAGRRHVARHARPPERDDARAAWLAVCTSSTAPEVFEAFARAFMSRASAELAAENTDALAELPDDERAALERGIQDTLRLAHGCGALLGLQEAARAALRAALRYGCPALAERSAERLCDVQRDLEATMPRPVGPVGPVAALEIDA